MSPDAEARLLAVLERQEQVLEKLEARLAAGDRTNMPVEEAAERLGCSQRQVWKYIATGLLVRVKHGRKTHVTTESVDQLTPARTRAKR